MLFQSEQQLFLIDIPDTYGPTLIAGINSGCGDVKVAKGVLMSGSMEKGEDFSGFKGEEYEILTGGSNYQLSFMMVALL